MHPATIIGTFRLLIVDVAMGQIPRSTERISSYYYYYYYYLPTTEPPEYIPWPSTARLLSMVD